jgi:hypothetical protein
MPCKTFESKAPLALGLRHTKFQNAESFGLKFFRLETFTLFTGESANGLISASLVKIASLSVAEFHTQ